MDQLLCQAAALAALTAATHVDAFGHQGGFALRQTLYDRLRSEPETRTSCLRQERQRGNICQMEHNQQAAFAKRPASKSTALGTRCFLH